MPFSYRLGLIEENCLIRKMVVLVLSTITKMEMRNSKNIQYSLNTRKTMVPIMMLVLGKKMMT